MGKQTGTGRGGSVSHLTHDRQITISVGKNRKATQWEPKQLFLSEFYAMLSTPRHSPEAQAEYLVLPKAQQDDLKDVGGFVGGSLNGPRRKADSVTGRDLITLDFDSIPSGQTEEVIRRKELPSFRVNKRIVIPVKGLFEWADRRASEGVTL